MPIQSITPGKFRMPAAGRRCAANLTSTTASGGGPVFLVAPSGGGAGLCCAPTPASKSPCRLHEKLNGASSFSPSPAPEHHTRRRIFVGLGKAALAVVALLLGVAVGLPAPVAAQTPQGAATFIENTGQSGREFESTAALAQSFTTGSDAGGYTLLEISLVIGSVVDGLGWSVAVHADAGGSPGASLYVLSPFRGRVQRGERRFLAQAGGVVLERETTYHVVVDPPDAESPSVQRTSSMEVDGTPHPGWSLPRGFQTLGSSGWGAPSSTHRLKVDIYGRVVRTLSVAGPAAPVTEAAGARLAFTVTLNPPSPDAVTVSYTLGGTAQEGAGEDYTAPGVRTLTFMPNDTSETITLTVLDDDLNEVNETVEVTLVAPSDGTAQVSNTAGSATAIIADDGDRAPAVCIVHHSHKRRAGGTPYALPLLSMEEPAPSYEEFLRMGEPAPQMGEGGEEEDRETYVEIPVYLLQDSEGTSRVENRRPSGRDVTIRYSLSGAGSRSYEGDPDGYLEAASEEDYSDPGMGSVTIPAGETEGVIRIEATDDKLDEGLAIKDGAGMITVAADERYEAVDVTIDQAGSTGVGAWCAHAQRRVLIYDSDAPPHVQVNRSMFPEDIEAETEEEKTFVSRGEDLVFRLNLGRSFAQSAHDVTLQYSVVSSRIGGLSGEWTLLEENGPPEYPVSYRSGVVTFPAGFPLDTPITFRVRTPAVLSTANHIRFIDAVLRSDDGSGMFPEEEGILPDQTQLNRKAGSYTWENSLELDDGETSVMPEADGATIQFTVDKRQTTRWMERYGNGTISGDLEIPYTLNPDGDDTAVLDVDYTDPGGGTLDFPQGAESATITLNLLNDDIREPVETLTIRLGSNVPNAHPLRYEVAGTDVPAKTATATVVIPSDRISDPPPTASITPPAAAVTEGSGNNLVFTVTLDSPSGVEEKVGYRLGGRDGEDDAWAMLDFRDTDMATEYWLADGEPCPDPNDAMQRCHGLGELTFRPGDTQKTITLEVRQDEIAEPTEKVLVRLVQVDVEGSPSIAPDTAATNGVEGLIEDDGDDPPSISIAVPEPDAVTEGGALEFTLTLSEANGFNRDITMLCSFGGTATAGEDYTPTDCEATPIARNQSTATITLQTTDDALYERDETVEITLTMPQSEIQRGLVTLGAATATATITDAQTAPELTIGAPTPAAVFEGGVLEFPVMLSGQSAHPVVVQYTLSGTATAGDDYTDAGGGTVTFAARETTKTITITTLDDALDEPDETVEVTLTAPDPSLAVPGAAMTQNGVIEDNDMTMVTVEAVATPVVEGEAAEFLLTRTPGALGNALTVAISITGASGVLSGAAPTTATFGVDSATTTVLLPTDNDDMDEPDAVVTLALGSPTSEWTAGDPGSANITVTDNDPPAITVEALAPTTVPEGQDARFRIIRTEGDISEELTVAISISDDSGVLTEELRTEATFEEDAATVVITLETHDDDVDEPDATVTLSLDTDPAPTDWTEGTPNQASITVSDNDDAPSLSFSLSPGVIEEDGGTARVTVSTGGTTFAAEQTIELTLGGVATLGADYRANDDSDDSAIDSSPYTLSLPAGAASASITLTAVNDTLDESNETITVSATHAENGGASLGAAQTITITDDDPPAITVAFVASPVVEGADAEFTLTRTRGDISAALIVAISVMDDSGVLDLSSSPLPTEAVFEADAATTTVSLATDDDDVDEPNAVVTLALDTDPAPTTWTAGMPDEASITVSDNDDAPSLTLSLSPASIPENGGTATLTVNSGATTFASDQTIELTFSGGAVLGTDYTASDDSDSSEIGASPYLLTLPAGAASASITITAVDDTTDEPNESVMVSALHVENSRASLGAAQTITITDDDPPAISVEAVVGTVPEGEDAEFRLTRTEGDLSAALTVEISVTDALVVLDLSSSPLPTEAVFEADSATTTVSLATDDDDVDEPNAVVTLALDTGPAPTTWTAGMPDEASITVTDDDGAPSPVLSFTADAIDEDGGTAMLTVSTGATTFSTAQSFVLTFGGAATIGTDYTAADDSDGSAIASSPYTLTLPARTESVRIIITAVDDDEDEPNETITVSATHVDAGGASLGAPQTLLITDDDSPQVSVEAPASLVEEGKPAVFEFTRTEGNLSETLRVAVSISDPSGALAVAPPTEVVFERNAATRTLSLATENDIVDEPNPTVRLSLDTSRAPTGWTAGTSDTASITVVDNDDATPPTLSLSAASIPEDGGMATLTVNAGATTFAVDQTIEISFGGDATLGADYTLADDSDGAAITASSYSLTLPAEAASASITITAVDDTLDEANETISVSALHVENSRASLGTAQTVIADADPPEVTVAAVADAVEEGAPAEFRLTRTEGDTSESLTVAISVTDALGVLDISPLPTEATFEANAATTTVSLATDDDDVDEANATVTLALDTAPAPTAWTAGTPNQASITVTDNDGAPNLVLSLSPGEIAEDGGTARVTVSTGGTTFAADQTVELTLDGVATLGADYTASDDSDDSAIASSPYTLTLPAGASSASITLTALDDAVDEPNEVITVSATHSGASLGTAQSVTITDDDPPAISVMAVAGPVVEGAPAEFELTRTEGDTSGRLTVAISVADASGVLDGAAPTEATFEANAATTTVTLATDDDDVDEAEAVVTLTLGAPTASWTAGTPDTASITVTDDDGAPSLALTLSPDSINEAAGGPVRTATVTVRTGATTFAAQQTIELTLGGVAVFGTDYTASDDSDGSLIASSPYSLTLPAGASSASITLTAVDDAVDEPNEAIAVSATHSGASLGAAQTITITDDDPPAISVAAVAGAVEEGAPAEFELTRTRGDLSAALTVAVSVTDESGVLSGAPPAEATFQVNAATTTVTLATDDDIVDEADATLTLALNTIPAPTAWTAGTPDQASITVTDNDAAPSPVLSRSPGAIAEDGGMARVIVSVDATTFSTPQTIELTFGGVAVFGTDYRIINEADSFAIASSPYTLTLPAGDTFADITLMALDDTLDEPNETITVSALHVENSRISLGAAQTITITDDDPPAITVAAVSDAVAEGDDAEFRLTRTEGDISRPLTVAISVTDESGVLTGAPRAEATFEANAATTTVTLATDDDNVDEAHAAVTLALDTTLAPTTWTAGTADQASITVIDNDGATTPILSLSQTSIAEDGETARLTVNTGGATFAEDQVIEIRFAGGAVLGTDYTAADDSDDSAIASSPYVLTLPAGALTASITLTALDDDEDEANETVELSAVHVENERRTSMGAPQILTIVDDDAPPVVVVEAVATPVVEGADVEFELTRTAVDISAALTVAISVTDASGVLAGAPQVQATFEANAATTTVTLATDDDDVNEPDAVVTLALDTVPAPMAWAAGTPGEASITVTDNDAAPSLALSLSENSITEDGGAATLTVSTGGATFAEAQTLEISFGGGAMLGTDYRAALDSDGSEIAASPWRWTLPARTSAASITLTAVDDERDEVNEMITLDAVHVDAGNAALATQTLVITDDDSTRVTVMAAASPVLEGELAVFTLTRTEGDIGEVLTVPVSISDASGVLTASPPGMVTFAAGALTATLSLPTEDDNVDEENATLRLSLGAPPPSSWVAGAPGEASITVLDNDGVPTPTLSLSRESIPEDGGTARLTVSTVGATFTEAQTFELSFDGVAVLGTDYRAFDDSDGSEIIASPYNWTLPERAGAASITITAVDDGKDELNETIVLSALHVENDRAPLSASQTLTITDDDRARVTVEAVAPQVLEGVPAQFRLIRTEGDLSARLTVAISVTDAAGVLGATPPAEARFEVGMDTTIVSLATHDDLVDEADAVVRLSLGTPTTDWTAGEPRAASITVTDNDGAPPPAPTFSLSQEVIEEDGGTARLTVHSGPGTFPVSQTMELNFGGDAAFGRDYLVTRDSDNARITSSSYRLTLPAHTPSVSVTIIALDDVISELDEAVTVSAVHVENSGTPVGPTHTLTIVDDETAPRVSISGSPSVMEGGALVFTVELTGISDQRIAVGYTLGEMARADADEDDDTEDEGVRMATAGEDYALPPGDLRLEFAPGERTKPLMVATLRDRAYEGDETVRVTLEVVNPRGSATLAPASEISALGVILDDASVQNTEPTEEWLGRFGGMLVTQVLEVVESRLNTSRLPGIEAKLSGRRAGSAHCCDALAGGGMDAGGGPGVAGAAGGRQNDLGGGLGALGAPPGNHPGGSPGSTGAFGYGAAPGASGAFTHPVFEGVAIGPGPVFTAPGRVAADAGRFGRGGASYRAPLEIDARRLLDTSSFTLTQQTSREGFASVWTRGAYMAFDGREGGMKVDGDVMAIQVGADWMSGRWIVGLAAVQSISEGEWSGTGRGDIETDLTSFHPYLGYRLTDRISTWAALGYGLGKLDITPNGQGAVKTNMELAMSAAGFRGELLRPGASGGYSLELRTDAVLVHTRSDARTGHLAKVRNDTSRVRFSLEGKRRLVLGQRETLTPTIELAMLEDGGDFERSRGVDLGLGLLYVNANGFATDVRVRSLLSHENRKTGEDTGKDEWGISGELRYDPEPFTPRGPSFSLESGYGGKASGGVDELFALKMSQSPSLGPGDALSGARRLSAELGYGVSVLGGRYTGTPWARFGLTEAGPGWRFGWRITPFGEHAPQLDAGIEYGGRGEEAGRDIRLHLDARF